jgi:hypothetical protein
MPRFPRSAVGSLVAISIALATMYDCLPVQASKIILKDGRAIEGKIARLSTLKPKPDKAPPAEGAPEVQSIVLLDNNLVSYFFSKQQLVEANEGANGEPVEHFNVRQHISKLGGRVAAVGPLVEIDPFDEYGRRIVTMATSQGLVSVVQGISEVWPTWTKVESVQVQGKNIIWDMRVDTHSIPPDTLRKILYKQIDPAKIDHRLKLVRLFLQSERYQDALQELEQIRRDFPERKAQFEPTVRSRPCSRRSISTAPTSIRARKFRSESTR